MKGTFVIVAIYLTGLVIGVLLILNLTIRPPFAQAPERYHVWCYTQGGQLVISRFVIKQPDGTLIDTVRGTKVVLPEPPTACAWLGLADE